MAEGHGVGMAVSVGAAMARVEERIRSEWRFGVWLDAEAGRNGRSPLLILAPKHLMGYVAMSRRRPVYSHATRLFLTL